MEIRTLTEEDYLESMRLSEYAFQYKISSDKVASRKAKLKDHKLLGIWDHDLLAAKLHIIPLAVFMNGEEWKMGGVAGVATYPEYRRSGYVKSLITEAVSEMNKEGQIVSLLAPFNIAFYRKFGWEILSDSKKITIDKLNLSFLPPQPGSIKRFSKENFQQDVDLIYREYSKRFMGMLVRDNKWWKEHVVDENSHIAVYYNTASEAKGYILYTVKERKMDVQEMSALNQEARMGLWNFICQHDSMVDTVNMTLSIHDPFPFFLQQPKVKMELQPYFMARIINAEECLKKFPFKHESLSIFLHLEDSIAPWNNGSYFIGNGEVKIFKEKQGSQCVHPPQRGLKLSINVLSALIFGYKRPIELYEMGFIIGSIEEIEKFERMIPLLKSSFYDFF